MSLRLHTKVLLLLAGLLLATTACLEEPPYANSRSSSDADAGMSDGEDATGFTDTYSGPESDASLGDSGHQADDAYSNGDTDTGINAPDIGEDTGNEEEPDTGPPPECGGDLWDDTHDGSNPWDEPMDCEAISSSWSCSLAADEVRVVEIVNEMRAQTQTCGDDEYAPVGPVTMEPLMRCASRMHSWDQQGRGFYSHYSPDGMGPGGRLSHVGFGGWGWGENIYMTNSTPEGAMQGWMASAGHCRNIMNGSFSRIGVGRYGGHYVMKLSG